MSFKNLKVTAWLKFHENLQPHNLIYQEMPQKIVVTIKATIILCHLCASIN